MCRRKDFVLPTGIVDSSSLEITERSTFGEISLLDDTDTVSLIDYPVQKGFTTLEMSAEDSIDVNLGDTNTIVVKKSQPSIVNLEDTATINQVNVVDTIEETTPFAEFGDKVLRINYTKIGEFENGWIFWGLLLSLIVCGVTKLKFPKHMSSLASNIFNYHTAQKDFEKTGERSQLMRTIMQVLFAFNGGLLSYFAISYYSGVHYSTAQALAITALCMAIILVLYFLKKLLFYWVAHIFDRISYAEECVFTVYVYNRALGICLYPVVIALAFVDPEIISTTLLLKIGYIVCAIFYLLRIFREIQISLKNKISFFYIFLYLCTLEFLPLMLLVKVLKSIVFTEFLSI